MKQERVRGRKFHGFRNGYRMRGLRHKIRRYREWVLLGVFLLVGVWSVHAHPGKAGKCSLCAQSLAEPGPLTDFEVCRFRRSLLPLDVQAPVLWGRTSPFASRAPPVA
jgi:hypothetical protein